VLVFIYGNGEASSFNVLTPCMVLFDQASYQSGTCNLFTVSWAAYRTIHSLVLFRLL